MAGSQLDLSSFIFLLVYIYLLNVSLSNHHGTDISCLERALLDAPFQIPFGLASTNLNYLSHFFIIFLFTKMDIDISVKLKYQYRSQYFDPLFGT